MLVLKNLPHEKHSMITIVQTVSPFSTISVHYGYTFGTLWGHASLVFDDKAPRL